MNQLSESTVRRMRKLAERRLKSGHEGQIAANALAALLSKHGVSEEEIIGEAVGEVAVGVYQLADSWRGSLANGLAQAYQCHTYWKGSTNSDKLAELQTKNQEREELGKAPQPFRWPVTHSIVFVGAPSNTAPLIRLFQQVEAEIERMDLEAYNALGDHERPISAAAKKWHNGFRHGAVAAVVRRVHIARIGKQSTEDIMKSVMTAKAISLGDMTAYKLGVRSGKTIDIETKEQLEGSDE